MNESASSSFVVERDGRGGDDDEWDGDGEASIAVVDGGG
jgi:hypothetical protein